MFIAKIQISISTTDEKRKVLIYNKSGSVKIEKDCCKEIEKKMAGKLKAFAKCSIKPNGELVVGDFVKAQDW